jgi:hypothetical protein
VTFDEYLDILKEKKHGWNSFKRNQKRKVKGKGGQVIEKSNIFGDCNKSNNSKTCWEMCVRTQFVMT